MANMTLVAEDGISAPEGFGVSSNGIGAASAANSIITGNAGKKLFLGGFVVAGLGATAAAAPDIIIYYYDLNGAPVTFTAMYNCINVPAGATTLVTPFIVTFNPPLPYPIAIPSTYAPKWTVQAASFGAGNTRAAVTSWGFTR